MLSDLESGLSVADTLPPGQPVPPEPGWPSEMSSAWARVDRPPTRMRDASAANTFMWSPLDGRVLWGGCALYSQLYECRCDLSMTCLFFFCFGFVLLFGLFCCGFLCC